MFLKTLNFVALDLIIKAGDQGVRFERDYVKGSYKILLEDSLIKKIY